MTHFNLKSLTFYGGAITAVVVLFEVVTAYGESNLKAPINIDGRYRLSYTQQPDCLNSNASILTIQQSGIYLNGSLLPAQNNAPQPTSAEKKTTLTGQMRNQQLSLVGTVPTSTLCNNISQAEGSNRTKDNSPSSVKIQSRVQPEEKTLEGQIIMSGIPKVIRFTAQRETPAQPSKSSH
jgi:hypothetical protein